MSISFNYPDFFTLSDLVERLVYATTKESKRIVFLVGAPFSAARNGALGVSDVDGIIAMIRKEFEGDPQAENDFDEKLRTALNPYQAATHFLQGRRGQSRLNAVIVDAVLQANHRQSDVPRDSITELRSLEQDVSSWALSDAHSQFALLAKK